jgi:hypothetical protein
VREAGKGAVEDDGLQANAKNRREHIGAEMDNFRKRWRMRFDRRLLLDIK